MDKIDYSSPNLSIPEGEKNDEWYKKCIRHYMNFYNKQPIRSATGNPNDFLGCVDRGLNYMSYYLGRQQNINYNHVTTDINGNTLQAVWIPGKKVQSLVNHRLGFLSRQFEEKDISSTSLSPEVVSRKEKLMEDALLQFDTGFQDFMAKLAPLGVSYEPLGVPVETPEEAERYIGQTLKDASETLATNIAKHIENASDSDTEYKKVFLDYHSAGVGAMLNYVENGDIKQRAIRFWDLVWDNLNDNPTKKNMKFVGYIERLTVPEVLSRWEFDDAEKSQLIQMAAAAGNPRNNPLANQFTNLYNTSTMLNWDYNQGQLLIACVTMYWVADRDLKYKNMKGDYGNDFIGKMPKKQKNKQGDYITQDLYQGVLIGNKWLREQGLAKNVVRNRENRTIPENPITVFTHNTVLGELMPPIGMICQHQDNMDFYRFKIMEIVSRDSGKNYILFGDKMEGTTSKSLISDFKSIGIHVTTGNTGESDDMTNAKRFLEYVDLTLDPNVMKYVELYREEESIMEKIMSTNQIDLGQQVNYVSKGTQAQTITQSVQGTIDLYQNFVKFNEIALQHAIELAKFVYTIDGDTSKLFVTGDRGAALLKITKDFKFEDLLIRVSVNDALDEAKRQRLSSYVQAWSQNPDLGLTPHDIIRLEQATTYSEMVAVTEQALARAEKSKQQAMQMQQENAMIQQQSMIEGQTQQEAMRQEGANQRADLASGTKLDSEAMKSETALAKGSMNQPV